MAWRRVQRVKWKVCWKWVFPYPCKKTVWEYCCTGLTKENRYPFVSVKWICCEEKEYKFTRFRWGTDFGVDLYAECRICVKDLPNPYRDDCTGLAGEITKVECPGTFYIGKSSTDI